MTPSTSLPLRSRVLVIDDAISIHEDFRKILTRPRAVAPSLREAHARLFGPGDMPATGLEFEINCAAQGEEGLALVRRALGEKRPFAVAFVDMRMPPGWDGIETTKQLWAVDPDLQVVICTAYSDRNWEETLAHLGLHDNLLILKKPFDNIEVLQLTHALSTKWAVARRDRERMAGLDEVVRQRTLELCEAEGRFTRVFQANPVATALQARADGRYIDANPAYLQLVGHSREALLSHPSTELQLWPETDVWPRITASIQRGTPLRFHATRLRTGQGEFRDVLLSAETVELGSNQCVLTSLEDVTERLMLERKLQQAQKLEAVGQLAAGVAHDFNNLLTVIQSYTSLTLDDPHLGHAHRDTLAQVQLAADRAAALTRQLLVFTRRQITQVQPLDLSATLDQMRDMLRRLIPEHIALTWNCADSLPHVLGDEANLEQVVMNLVVNARDAMPDGGRVTISLNSVTIDALAASRHPNAREGRYVRLSVSDTGSGMSPEVQAHLFEPFFTTKGVGKGTGLGLSTVYAIVGQHGGWVEVESRLGKGSGFHVHIPACDTPEPADEPGADAPLADMLTGRGERILLVEDELIVRQAAATIARRAGYHVTEVEDAPRALDVWRVSQPGFDLLLTDMVMPNGTGADLANALRTQRPDLKVIIMTGYSRDLLMDKARPHVDVGLLLKPFSAADLLTMLRETLDR